MRKSLAFALALLLTICMIPTAQAQTGETVAGGAYTAKGVILPGVDLAGLEALGTNHFCLKYEYGQLEKVATGRFTEDACVARIEVTGFDRFKRMRDVSGIEGLVNGLAVDKSGGSEHLGVRSGAQAASLTFPVELTEQSRRLTLNLTLRGEVNGVYTVQTVTIALDLINQEELKPVRTARILDIQSDAPKELEAYVVGGRIYLDYTGSARAGRTVTITFGDESGARFTEIAWAGDVLCEGGPARIRKLAQEKLKDSATAYQAEAWGCETGVQFQLETRGAVWKTGKYDIVVRENIPQPDPRGIYFAQSEATIRKGERYRPVVMGVATGRAVTPDALLCGEGAPAEVIDIDNECGEVIGTQPGTAYITALYRPGGLAQSYESSSMKITVLPEEESAPSDRDETCVVLCRRLNVRSGPSLQSRVIGRLRRGDAVRVAAVENGWARLESGAYVSARYIAK